MNIEQELAWIAAQLEAVAGVVKRAEEYRNVSAAAKKSLQSIHANVEFLQKAFPHMR
jgi:hypothetical protein